MTLRAFRLRGAGAAAALDWLHVRAAVRGAVEHADSDVVVWLDEAPPALPFAVAVTELPADVANATATGLEDDAPIQVAGDLLVRPPWVARPAGFDGVELVVPRGMAFGSGEHDSTQAALLAVHRAWCDPPSFADVGTGSGILMAYARARGCAQIAGCDIEPPAVAAARALVPAAAVTLGGPATLAGAFDFVVANLTAAELHAALPDVLARWTRRAPLVLSGMRDGEVEAVHARLPAPAAALRRGAFTALTCPATRPD
ncbi:MAG: 50S ribosomal protein L11 methyltransferase [Planctomycetota bacterium]